MKLLWLSCNKCACKLVRSRSLYNYLERQQADVMLFSELKRSELEVPLAIDGYSWAFHSRNLGIALRSSLHCEPLVHLEDFYASILLEDRLQIASVYLDSKSARLRKAQLQAIQAQACATPHDMLIGGDFNTIQRPQDGIYNNKLSNWVKPGEKRIIDEFLHAGRLEDPYHQIAGEAPDFSFVGAHKGRPYAFRSDFVLCSAGSKPRCCVTYDADPRARKGGFTDPSAVIIDLQ